MLTVRAPGKLVIFGEYAVLHGAPALVQAVDRYARVSVSEQAGGDSQLLARPLLRQAAMFHFDDEHGFQWQDALNHQRLPFIAPLMNYLGPWRADGGLELTLDTGDFFAEYGAERRKLGIGSSAALSVAMTAAWYAYRHDRQSLDRERWLRPLVELHRRLQDGRGSGVDVAASLYGGQIIYTINDEQSPHAVPVAAAPEIEWMWIWLGQSASTRDFLTTMQAFAEQRPASYKSLMDRLQDTAQAGREAVDKADASELLRQISAYGEGMRALGEAAGAPIYTADHRRLAQLAQRYGVAFKPSGAGGGDIALIASQDTAALSSLARQVRTAGYQVVAMAPARHGLSITNRAE
ncbi:MAG: phosphomevalonate kinase [Wenzhouxiangellaceae bacterium]